MGEILNCDHSNESYQAVLSGGAVYYAVEAGFQFLVHGWNPIMWPIKWKLLSSTLLWFYYAVHKWFLVLSLNVKSSRVTIQMKAPGKWCVLCCTILMISRPTFFGSWGAWGYWCTGCWLSSFTVLCLWSLSFLSGWRDCRVGSGLVGLHFAKGKKTKLFSLL